MEKADLVHLLTHLIGIALAILALRWCMREMPRDWRDKRVPLITGPFQLRLLWPVLGSFAALVPVLWGIIALGLIPPGSVDGFVLMLVWLTVGFISALLALNARQIRRGASGWLVIDGEHLLRVESPEGSATFPLRPGSVRLNYIDGPPGHVQFRIQGDAHVVHVWGQLALRHLSLVSEGPPVSGHGLMIGSSIKPLVEWLRPYVSTG